MCILPEPYYIFNVQSITAHGTVSDNGFFTAVEPDYKAVITDANLRRRMGHLLKMAVWCGLRTLDGIDSEDVCGIITATGMGFMKDTLAMADSMIDRNEEMLNPMPFMQSTFNTASGYIAMMRGIRACNTAYVHREGGFMSAVADALMLIGENPGKGVLVGAFDEATPAVDRLRRRLGEYKTADGQCLPLGEGASSMYMAADISALPSRPQAMLLGFAPVKAGIQHFIDASCDMNQGLLSEDIEIVRCSDYVRQTGAFMTMLPAIACIVLSAPAYSKPAILVMDDVNPAGSMILFRLTE